MINRDKLHIVQHYLRCAQDEVSRALDGIARWGTDGCDFAYVADQLDRATEDAAMAQHEFMPLYASLELAAKEVDNAKSA